MRLRSSFGRTRCLKACLEKRRETRSLAYRPVPIDRPAEAHGRHPAIYWLGAATRVGRRISVPATRAFHVRLFLPGRRAPGRVVARPPTV